MQRNGHAMKQRIVSLGGAYERESHDSSVCMVQAVSNVVESCAGYLRAGAEEDAWDMPEMCPACYSQSIRRCNHVSNEACSESA